MYESFFELREKPFSLLPDPGFLFMSRQHQQALTLLEYGLMNQAGFIILTGDIGSGKTTLMRHLVGRLDPSFSVGLISNTHQSLGELMDWVCMAFDIRGEPATKLEKYQAFIDFLVGTYAKGGRVLLIVDEAQNLGVEKLEELRLLSNINAGKDLVLQLMLLGQPQLRDLLTDPALEQFAQRVTASYHIGPLDPTETESYIRHRIFVAGGTREIFTHDACLAVHHYSKGVPRLINLICDTALVYAYGADERLLTEASIDEFIASHTPSLMIPVDLDREARTPSSKLKLHGVDSGADVVRSDGAGTQQEAPSSAESGAAPSLQRLSDRDNQPGVAGRPPGRPAHETTPSRGGEAATPGKAARDVTSRPTVGRASPAERIRTVSDQAGSAPSSTLNRQTVAAQASALRREDGAGAPTLSKIDPGDALGLRRPADQPRRFPTPAQPLPRTSAVPASPTRARPLRWAPIASVILILASLAAGSIWFTQFQTPEDFQAAVVDVRDRAVALAKGVGEQFKVPIGSSDNAGEAQGPEQKADLTKDEPIPDPLEDRSGGVGETGEGPLPITGGPGAEIPDLSADRVGPVVAQAETGTSAQRATPPANGPDSLVSEGGTGSEVAARSASPGSLTTEPQQTPPSSGRAAPSSVISETDGDPATRPTPERPSSTLQASTDERLALTQPAERPPPRRDSAADESSEPILRGRSGAGVLETSPREPMDSDLIANLQRQLSQFSLPVERNGRERLTADLGPFVRFEDGSVRLDSDGEAILSRIAAILKGLDPVRILVIAHTDSSGSDSVNQRLSARRAENVAMHLISEGVPGERVAYEGKGSSELRVDAAEERLLGPWVNRRIELQLFSTEAPSETGP